MGWLSKRNYQYNCTIPLPAAPINGQALGAVSGMKFGFSHMGYSGCEVIAVYNALLLGGCPAALCEVARYMERYRMLLGFWGTNFLFLGRCLRRFGLHAGRLHRTRAVGGALKSGHSCLYVYWVGRAFCSPLHTVLVQCDKNEKVRVYNAFNHSDQPLELPLHEFLHRRRMLIGYEITKS